MEVQPEAAWHTNVIGTANVIAAAQASQTGTFVLISTDKAVNPTSVMGASKRMAELVVRSIGEGAHMNCVITRFGNVLDSNGSVIPLFRRQIEAGGPLTLTHPEVTRYFMTIPEAVQLVMEAAATSEGDDIFVFDMGERVRIADLARRIEVDRVAVRNSLETSVQLRNAGSWTPEDVRAAFARHLPEYLPSEKETSPS